VPVRADRKLPRSPKPEDQDRGNGEGAGVDGEGGRTRQAEDQRAEREPDEGGGHDLAGAEPGVPPLQPVGRDDVRDDRGGGVEEGDVGGA